MVVLNVGLTVCTTKPYCPFTMHGIVNIWWYKEWTDVSAGYQSTTALKSSNSIVPVFGWSWQFVQVSCTCYFSRHKVIQSHSPTSVTPVVASWMLTAGNVLGRTRKPAASFVIIFWSAFQPPSCFTWRFVFEPRFVKHIGGNGEMTETEIISLHSVTTEAIDVGGWLSMASYYGFYNSLQYSNFSKLPYTFLNLNGMNQHLNYNSCKTACQYQPLWMEGCGIFDTGFRGWPLKTILFHP